MKLGKIPPHVLRDVRERGLFTDSDIEAMTAETLFDEFLKWNGIIGYGSNLYHTAVLLAELEAKGK